MEGQSCNERYGQRGATAPQARRADKVEICRQPYGNPKEGFPQPADEEGVRDEQNAPIAEKVDDVADPDRGAEADAGVGHDRPNEGDDGSEVRTTEEAMPDEGNEGASDESDERDESTAAENARHISLVRMARRAAGHVAALTGRYAESVISIERRDGGWRVGVEVVETHRIPDSADILAIYEVLVRSSGDLISYRRIRRYTRGQVDRPRW